MRILLLGFGKIAYMPYMNFYLDALKERSDIELDLVYWDRDGKPDTTVPSQIKNIYKYEAYLEEHLPLRKKMVYFINYRLFSIKVLKQNRYDYIILLHTTPGLTVMDYLQKHYKGKYILDFRDISHENISFYRLLVGKLAKNSAFTFVSSNAFRNYLPNMGKIHTIHNYIEDALLHQKIRKIEPRDRNVIRISFWGFVRHVSANKKLIDALGNDRRFELHYFGRMQQEGRELQEHVHKEGYENIFFHGQYMPNERYDFAQRTDLIHNLYDLANKVTTNAMGNKYYDGIIFHIPQICTEGSYMGAIITQQKLGITLNLDDNKISDKLWNYYYSIDWDEFDKSCEAVLNEITKEQYIAKEKLLALVGN